MKEVVVLSGKGGTGKTSIVGSFTALADSKVLTDCDVDAADLRLLFRLTIRENHDFWSGQVALIDEQRCTHCGLCQEICRFAAIKEFKVDTISCEGCGFCSKICPVEAVTMMGNMAGRWFISDTGYGPLVHARLCAAQENSGKLVALVRQQARLIAEKQKLDYIISDGPPGIGCPVISALSGAHLALLVTEPTLSGIHDLERVVSVCRHFDVPVLACINKYDIDSENAGQVENYCLSHNIEIGARIPFANVFTEAMVQGLPVVKYSDGIVSQEIMNLWDYTVELLRKN